MKVCMVSGMELDLDDPRDAGTRVQRYQKYLAYYRGLKDELGFTDFVLIDNLSSPDKLKQIEAPDVRIISGDKKLKRDGVLGYPYVWRALFYTRNLLSEYDKVIQLDSDGYILSRRLGTWARELNSGWNTIWCRRYGFPESALQVLCKDFYPQFMAFTEGDYNKYLGQCCETFLPYTNVDLSFNSDRWGEDRAPQTPEMDFYAQCPVDIKMKYEGSHESI